MNAPVVGVAEHYAEFVRLCRARIEALGITYLVVDSICGFPNGYTSTLLSGGKTMSVYSHYTIAHCLGLLPAYHHDDEKLAKLRQRSDWVETCRSGPRFRRPLRHAHGTHNAKYNKDFFRIIGIDAGLARKQKMTSKQRSASARKAALARWSKA